MTSPRSYTVWSAYVFMASRTASICAVSKPANFMVLANFWSASDCSMPSPKRLLNSDAALSAMSAMMLPMAAFATLKPSTRALLPAPPALPMPLVSSADALLLNVLPALLPALPMVLPISSTTDLPSSFG